MTTIARRHACRSRSSVLCDSGPGKAPRLHCRHCGADLVTEEGYLGLFVWEAANQYRPEDAIEVETVEARAQIKATAQNLVVRWIRREDLSRVPLDALPPRLWRILTTDSREEARP